MILNKVEQSIGAPASTNRITKVEIYKSDKNGNVVTGKVNTYDRTRLDDLPACPTARPWSSRTRLTAPSGTRSTSRCNVHGRLRRLGRGRPDRGQDQLHATTPFTPLGSFVGSGSTSYTLVESNTMRMEPIL